MLSVSSLIYLPHPFFFFLGQTIHSLSLVSHSSCSFWLTVYFVIPEDTMFWNPTGDLLYFHLDTTSDFIFVWLR